MWLLHSSHENLSRTCYRPVRLTLTTISLLGILGGVFLAGSSLAASVPTGKAVQMVDAAAVATSPEQRAAWLSFALADMLQDRESNVLLSEKDANLYRSIFAAQDALDWAKADHLMTELTDKRLVGHVLSQRFMHPTAYKATYAELKSWLDRYADLPDAKRVHTLAVRRQPQHDKTVLEDPSIGEGVKGGLTAAALMGSNEIALMQRGLDAWKQQDFARALTHFQALARSDRANPWDQSAGAFWTARTLTRLGRPAEVSTWLRRAAQHARTFYGLLASRQLGVEGQLNWGVPSLTAAHLIALDKLPAGHRALALLQVGQVTLAEDELSAVHPRGNNELEEALVSLAATAGLSNLALRIGTAITDEEGALYDAALYPMPNWEPSDGFKVNRALIFALIRQESRFDTHARSSVGATGLMQLMPTTASYIAGRDLGDDIDQLHNPVLNITLGQRYVQYLMNMPEVKGNLVYVLASYNAGPSQLARWKKEAVNSRDPLLFIESIGAAETRGFVQRVLANYWIYQQQMGQDPTTLTAMAGGNPPVYEGSAATMVSMNTTPPTLH